MSTSDIVVEYAPDELPEVRGTERRAQPQGIGMGWGILGASHVHTHQLDGGMGDVVAASAVTLEFEYFMLHDVRYSVRVYS